jgi:hypothetical protein
VIGNIFQFVSEQVTPHTFTSRNQQVTLAKTSLFIRGNDGKCAETW